MDNTPLPTAKHTHLSVIGHGRLLANARPIPKARKGPWIKRFQGGRGKVNCPGFYHIRDGFGCRFKCAYCSLERFNSWHQEGAEYNPEFETLCREVARFLRRPGHLGLILGGESDGWGWAISPEVLKLRLHLIEMFRGQNKHTLIFLTKDNRVHEYLKGVPPTKRVILSWSVNAPEVAERYEMGAHQAEARLSDAVACREAGWRIRLRLDPMIPIAGWRDYYTRLAQYIAEVVKPEQVTLGTWRVRPVDKMCKEAPPELRLTLEKAKGGWRRVRDRLAMYEAVWAVLRGHVPQISLCKETLDIEALIYSKYGIREQACNCLDRPVEPVGLISARALVRANRPALREGE